MEKKKFIRTLEDFELKHKIVSFIGIIILTLVITRIITFFNDPNLFISGYELHHFYLGVILLIIVSIFMVFSKKRHLTYLTFSAFAIGLILDEFLFVMGKVRSEISYSSTFLPSSFFILLICIILFLTSHYFSKRGGKNDNS
jgi:hypothetical protein